MGSQLRPNNFAGHFQSENNQWVGNSFETGGGDIHFGSGPSNDKIDRACLRVLRCPDSFAVKNRLKENKDKLLHQSFDWILRDEQYVSWQDGQDIGLLWIKGGAGKGKTMMSIGLIEELCRRPIETTAVTYFFCQNADYELNTVEAIIKGLVFQLVRQQESLKKCLRKRWDTVHERFDEDVSSWRGLWNTFMEMLDCCACPSVYVIVDALDECRDDAMAELLKLIVRTGLDRPSQVKWLLTSRPLDSAEQELLAGSDQVRVSLELNAQHLAQGVRNYIFYKVAELDRRWGYGSVLRREVEQQLGQKAEDTFLWVGLVCKRLENVRREEALTAIRDLPPGLYGLYHRAYTDLCHGETAVVEGCVQLLQVMMLAYRPLHVWELRSVADMPDDPQRIAALIDRSASFVKTQGKYVEFVHQSARDYLTEKKGRSPLDLRDQSSHGDIAMKCLDRLSKQLTPNFLSESWPGMERDEMRKKLPKSESNLLASLDYAATFWVQHLEVAYETQAIRVALSDDGVVQQFFRSHFLQWLVCLSLLDQLPQAVKALELLAELCGRVTLQSDRSLLLPLSVQDARRFLSRHYATIFRWPLQIYSSAIVFSPKTSLVRKDNLDRVPAWLTKMPIMEVEWTPLIRTLRGHLDWVNTVVFSPDGQQLASGSRDNTIKVWDVQTGQVVQTLTGHSHWVNAVVFLPGGQQLASGSWDKTIKVWDVQTGQVAQTLTGHSDRVNAVVFSPDRQQLASGSEDKTIKVWDVQTGQVVQTLTGHSDIVNAVVFSPGGRQLVSGSHDKTIKVWDVQTGQIVQTLTGHSGIVSAVVFSPDGQQLASGSYDNTIKVWDVQTGQVVQTLTGHSGFVNAVVFSPGGQQLASGSWDKTIKVWDVQTGQVVQTLTGYPDIVNAVVFSPDGQQLASGSWDKTIKVRDVQTGQIVQTLTGYSGIVSAVVFSPDGQQLASGSWDNTIKVWDVQTGQIVQTLTGHSDIVNAVVFSPDGQQLASGSWDKTIKVWDVQTGQVAQTLTGHSSLVRAVVFSPNGQQLASGSDDNTIKVWKIKQLLRLTNQLRRAVGKSPKLRACRSIETPGPVYQMRFSADGGRVITDQGIFNVEKIPHTLQHLEADCTSYLRLLNDWIYCDSIPVLRLHPNFEAQCYDTKDDYVAVGVSNGQVLIFAIDRVGIRAAHE